MEEATPIMVVDDEHLVRSGIRHLLKDQAEFRVAAEAANGREAVEKVAEFQYGIIIMDVKMPVMDGLEALEKIRSRAPRARTIILSGYSDFHFAQKALQLGANDYLLKPVSPTDLLTVLRRVKGHLLEEKRQSEQEVEDRQRLRYSLSAFMEQFYLQLLRGDLSCEEIAEKMEVLDLKDSRGSVLLISLDHTYRLKTRHSATEYAQLIRRLRSLVEKRLAGRDIRTAPVLPVDEGTFAVICPDTPALQPVELAGELVREVRRSLMEQTVTVAIGSAQTLPRIRESYQEALSRIKQRLLLGGDKVLARDVAVGARGSGYPELLEQKLGKALRFGDREQVKGLLREILGWLRRTGLSMSDWHQLAFDIVELGYQNLRQLGFPPERAFFPLEKSQEISRLGTLDDLQLWLENSLGQIMEWIRGSSAGPSLAVKKALSFIEDHYTEAIKLSDVAAQVCLSANYLSQLFKQKTGRTFLEHLSHRRIEEAKRLLLQSMLNVSEIAYKVGYDNPRYFSELFHKYELVTPRQFREGRVGGQPAAKS